MGRGRRAACHICGDRGNMTRVSWGLSPGRFVGSLVCGMIALSLANGLTAGRFPAWPAGVLAWVVGAALFPTISRFQRMQVFGLAVVGGAAAIPALGKFLGPKNFKKIF